MPLKKQLFTAILLMVVVAATTALHAWLVKPAVDIMFENPDSIYFVIIPIAILGVTVIKGFAQYFQLLIMSMLNLKIVSGMRMRMYKHFIYSDIAMYNRRSSGMLISNMTHDIGIVANTINTMLNGLVRQLLTVIFLMGVMFYTNFELAMISFFGVPLAAAPIIIVGKKLKSLSIETQASMEKFTAQMDDTLKSSKLVKAYNAEEYEIKRMGGIVDGLLKLSSKIARLSLIASPFTETLTGVAIAVVLWYGGMKVATGATTAGDFFAFFTAMMMAYKPLKSVSNLHAAFQIGIGASKRVFMIMDEMPEITDKPGANDLQQVKGQITFKDVNFQYIEDQTALNGLNLTIEPGQKVALVGQSGAGKSTMMSLLLRFYDPNNGHILLDGHDLRDITLNSLRNSMAFVSQEVQLFDDSIKENIRYCVTDASDEDIIQAAKLAEAHEFITATPQGYDTFIGQSGIRLSGGQRQRLSIARAILYNAPILLLDEATSSLDTESENNIKAALDHLMENRTTLVIAHRLSTVINADKICVIKDGQLVEEGTHDELIEKDGEYANLYSKQFQG